MQIDYDPRQGREKCHHSGLFFYVPVYENNWLTFTIFLMQRNILFRIDTCLLSVIFPEGLKLLWLVGLNVVPELK